MGQLDNMQDYADDEPRRYNSGSSLLRKYDIPLHHLDFDYVNKCNDANELEKILIILKSGEEGHYPQLIARTEERIAQLKPNSKHLRKASKVLKRDELDSQQSKDISSDICSFIDHMVYTDEELDAAKKKGNHAKLPEVRTPKVQIEQKKTNPSRIRSTDYKAWDKYDVETELLKMDLEDEKLKKQAQTESKKKKKQSVTINEFSTKSEAKYASMEETSKAVEYLKVREYDTAIDHYTLAIGYLPSRCTYTNRAGAYMMMNKYKDAITDYDHALRYDCNNFETIYSISYCHYKMEHYNEAWHYIQRAININPNNEYAQTLAEQIHQHVNNPGKVRMKIVDVKSNSGIKSILKRDEKSIISIPGCSKMPGPYYKVVYSQDPIVIQREEMLVAAQPRRIFMGNIDSMDDDGDCLVNHFENTRHNHKGQSLVKADDKPHMPNPSYQTCENQVEDTYSKVETDHDDNNFVIQTPDAIRSLSMLSSKNENSEEEIRVLDTNANESVANKTVSNNNNLMHKISENNEKDLKGGGEPCLEENNNVVPDNEIHVPFSFLQAWQNGRKKDNYAGFVDILKSLDMSRIPQVIGNKMDAKIFSEILNCMYRHLAVANEVEKVYSTLVNLCKVDRFSILTMFLSADDKRLVRNLVDFLSQHGMEIPQDVFLQYGLN